MASPCCNETLLPVIKFAPPELSEWTKFISEGKTLIAQYCSKCGKINRTKSTDDWFLDTYSEELKDANTR